MDLGLSNLDFALVLPMSSIINVAETKGLAVLARFGLAARWSLVILQALVSTWGKNHCCYSLPRQPRAFFIFQEVVIINQCFRKISRAINPFPPAPCNLLVFM